MAHDRGWVLAWVSIAKADDTAPPYRMRRRTGCKRGVGLGLGPTVEADGSSAESPCTVNVSMGWGSGVGLVERGIRLGADGLGTVLVEVTLGPAQLE